jgi:Flp pilus assembly protein TadG
MARWAVRAATRGDGPTRERIDGRTGPDSGLRSGPRAEPRTRPGAAARPDRGVSTLELALLTPILLIVMLLVVQFAMVYHARHVALAAAQAGARVARSEESAAWEQNSRTKARTYLRQIGPRLLNAPRVDTNATGDQRFVVVSGYAVEVLPFFRFQISERSGGPIECFRPDVGTGDACGPTP